MLRDEVRPISVDDHVIEPAHVFADHIEPRFRDRAPRIVEHDDAEGWLWEDRFYPLTFQGNAQTRKFRAGEAGRGEDLFARRYEDMIPAAYDVHERVRAMEEDGVWAELLFPTFPRFGGTQFLQADDTELALAMVRAWNDWMLDEWCAAYPERFIPQTLVPLWDVTAAVAEIERCAAKGSRAVLFVENPHPLGLPSFPTGHWRPVFEACNDTGLPLSMHIGTSSGLIAPSPETTPSVGIALCGINSMSALGDMIFSGVFNGLPRCRVALSEGGAGWVPYVLERLDYTWERSRYEGLRNMDRPSEVFAEHVWVCMVSDRYAIRNRDLIGVDKLLWEADFPHNDSNWPNSRKVLADALADVPDDECRRIAELNARELYCFPG
ncbi:MAG TPA: amidohydrolase family protein [Acidimicrobiia bacterium]|jgi:predicted TIM-barrel fold metal-dependent hydrolase|nr:amidohydrolase family protein [Acidimicrobiia bacterium]